MVTQWMNEWTNEKTLKFAYEGQHAPRTHKHCRPCATHAHDTGVRAHTCLYGLFWVKHSYQPGTFQCTSSCNNRLRCRWIPQRTIKLRVAWEVMDNTRPVRTNTADRAPCTLVTQMYVRVLVCTVCFQWNIRTNWVHSSEQRVEGQSKVVHNIKLLTTFHRYYHVH